MGVDGGDVAGAEPSFGVEGGFGHLRVLPVAGEDAGPFDQQLAIVGEADLEVGKRLADGAEAIGGGVLTPMTGRFR